MEAPPKIQSMPFYRRVIPLHSKQAPQPVPDRLPFEFEVDTRFGFIRQRRTAELLSALETVYTLEENVGYLQDTNVLARKYGVDFMGYLLRDCERTTDMEVLEIGCGGCTLLAELKERGMKVMGIDSSPFSKVEGQKNGIAVVTDFFPSPQITQDFDLIFCVDVLEHIDDPTAFLLSIKAHLKPGGRVVINVPDCTESIGMGDISMIIHQHLNYFDIDSLPRVVSAAGFLVDNCEAATYGGSLYLTASVAQGGIGEPDGTSFADLFEQFSEKANTANRRFVERISGIIANSENSLGFYVPLRAIPYIYSSGLALTYRFFDDTGHWHGQQFDGVDVGIENITDLAASPVSHIFVMSLTFGEAIKRRIRDTMGEDIEIVLLQDICA